MRFECKRHKAGCGCLSDTFCQRARNNFSNILSSSQSAAEFSERLQALVHHVQDLHKWDGGQCLFHGLVVCSCGRCEDKNEPQCQGREYHTREILSCPFHLLVYQIECHLRAQMAEELVDPILKRGHSNWLESSHSVFIRFRPKHIHLERLHYHVATNLRLLKANQTQENSQQGSQYQWKLELFQQLNLPIYDGVRESLERLNRRRKKVLDTIMTTEAKKRRVEWKNIRAQDAQQRKLWSKQHRDDTYGEEEDPIDEKDLTISSKRANKGKTDKNPCNRCGSTTHSRSTHRDCPYNKRNTQTEPSDITKTGDANTVEESIHDEISSDSCTDESGKDSDLPEAYCDLLLSDDELDIDMLDDAITSGCTYGALNRAHKKSCPKNSSVRYLTETRRSKPLHKPGEYVFLHSTHLKDEHRVIECLAKPVANLYRLCCETGVLTGVHPESDLTKSLSIQCKIPLDKWRTSERLTVRAAQSDPSNLHQCECERPPVDLTMMIDLTETPTAPKRSMTDKTITDSGGSQKADTSMVPLADTITVDLSNDSKSMDTPTVWVQNSLYTLHGTDRQLRMAE